MTTKSELLTWLNGTDQIRVILVEITGVLNTGGSGNFYLSNRPFTSAFGDTPANTAYTACIAGGVSFSESIDLNGSASIGYGDIELENIDGVRDAWLNYIWANKPVNVYIGDARWTRADFYPIFSGLIKDIDSNNRNTINLILVDTLQLLNVAISEAKLGGATENADQLIPLTFGECFNITPLSTVPSQLRYKVHNGPIEDIIEARDNGAPISITKDLANGEFVLNQFPAGTITCSVQGDKPSGTYSNKIGAVVTNILTRYGKTISAAKLDSAAISAFDASTDAAIGVHIQNRENVLDICQQLASSVDAFLTTTLDGKIKLVQRFADYTGSVAYDITTDDLVEKTLTVSEKLEVSGAVKLAYCKNWTSQESGLAFGLPTSSSDLFAREWFYSTQSDATVLTNYGQTAEPPQRDTLLLTAAKANAETTRQLAIVKQPRFIYSGNYYQNLLLVELGDAVRLTNPRFGLSSGKIGMVVNISRDWLNGQVTLGIYI